MAEATYLTKPFANWELDDAKQAITDTIKAQVGEAAFKENQLFIEEDDHFQDMTDWMGPTGGASQVVQAATKIGVKRQFTPVSVANECLDNYANALLSTEAALSFVRRVPKPVPENEDEAVRRKREQQERDLLTLWNQRVDGWIKRRDFWDLARQAVRRSRWGVRGSLRPWVPPATIEEAKKTGAVARTLPTGLTPEQALERVQVSAPSPDVALLFEHPDTHQRCAIFTFKTADDKDAAELWYLEGEGEAQLTVYRRVSASGKPVTFPGMKLGGRLPLAEMEGRLLLTEPVRRQQRRLDFFETMAVRLAEQAGHPERYTLNAKPHGLWSKTPPTDVPALDKADDAQGVTWYLIPAPRILGPAYTTDLRGVDFKDKDGNQQLATPGVVFKEPTSPEGCLKLAAHGRSTILRECKQGHLDLSEQSETSGWSRVQARVSFLADVNNGKAPLEQLVADTIDAVLALAGLMSSEIAQFLAEWRPVVQARVSLGPVSPEEEAAILTRVEKGLLSMESALSLLQVEDVPTELERLRREPRAQLALLKLRAEVMAGLTSAGASLPAAARIAGLESEHLDVLDDDAEATEQQIAAERAAEAEAREGARDRGDAGTPDEPDANPGGEENDESARDAARRQVA